MHHNTEWMKVTRYLSNESSEIEKREVEAKMSADQEFAKLVQQMQQIISIRQKSVSNENVEEKWAEIKSRLENGSVKIFSLEKRRRAQEFASKERARRFRSNLVKYAAVLVLLIGASIFFTKNYSQPENQQEEYRVVSVGFGERMKIQLKDGTIVNLDAGSELKYPTKFGETRDVYLKGEGYFQVAHNPKRPFRVHVEKALVQVLGTKFNICAWEENKRVTVTVKEGRVALSKDEPSDVNKIILTKGKQSALLVDGTLTKALNVDADEYLNWMHNEIHFHNVTLKQILSQLERWYEIKYEADEKVLDINKLTLNIKRTNLDDVIELIAVMTNTNVKRNGKVIKFVAN